MLSGDKAEVLDFNAKSLDNDQLEIKWITKNENETVNFELQKLNIFGSSYKTIAMINGQGSAQEKNYYRYIDNTNSDTTSYRLKKITPEGVTLFYIAE